MEELQEQGQTFIQQLWRGLGPQGTFPDTGLEQVATIMAPTLVLNGKQERTWKLQVARLGSVNQKLEVHLCG